jgi:hypothetical protein
MPASVAVMCPRVSAEHTRLLVCYRYAHEVVADPAILLTVEGAAPLTRRRRDITCGSHGRAPQDTQPQ